jgi:hypothetical protein
VLSPVFAVILDGEARRQEKPYSKAPRDGIATSNFWLSSLISLAWFTRSLVLAIESLLVYAKWGAVDGVFVLVFLLRSCVMDEGEAKQTPKSRWGGCGEDGVTAVWWVSR